MSNILLKNAFQVAYLTNDLEAAVALYLTHYGVGEFAIREMPTGEGGPARRLALAWTGPVMVEIIQIMDTPSPLYEMDFGPGAFAMRHHHVGHLCDTREHLEQVRAALDDKGIAISWQGERPGNLSFIYADTRAIDSHYREYIWLEEEGQEYFRTIPRYG
jgi:hypothetical protein